MKTPNPQIAIVLISVVSTLLSPATTSFAAEHGDKGVSDVSQPTVHVEVVESPSFEDQNWPIIKVETYTQKDPFTGQDVTVTTVIRRGPPETSKVTSKIACEANETDQVTAASATCVYRAPETVQRSVTVGGVTGYAKNYADNYCSGPDCSFYKMTKLEIWWTRIGTGWVVRTAYTRWGCNGACSLCPDLAPYTYYYQNGPFTPAWNGLTSVTYRYTSSGWPVMKTTALGVV